MCHCPRNFILSTSLIMVRYMVPVPPPAYYTTSSIFNSAFTKTSSLEVTPYIDRPSNTTTMGNSSSSNISPSSRTSHDRSNAASNLSNTISGSMSNLSSRITGGGSNNNATHIHRPTIQLPSSLPSPFRSGTGSLGLSKAELDARCQPSG